MNDLHICGLENESPGYADLQWTLPGMCGYCVVRDCVVETPQLCKDDYVELRPSAIRQIRTECQKWIDEMPERERANQEWEDNYNFIREAWDKWEDLEENHVRNAIPSMSELPMTVAVEGRCVFIEVDDECSLVYCETANYPTWGTLLKMFDKCIQATGDDHHVFLEGICPLKDDSYYRKYIPQRIKDSGLPVYIFSTGS
jgi:hypothetical protein